MSLAWAPFQGSGSGGVVDGDVLGDRCFQVVAVGHGQRDGVRAGFGIDEDGVLLVGRVAVGIAKGPVPGGDGRACFRRGGVGELHGLSHLVLFFIGRKVGCGGVDDGHHLFVAGLEAVAVGHGQAHGVVAVFHVGEGGVLLVGGGACFVAELPEPGDNGGAFFGHGVVGEGDGLAHFVFVAYAEAGIGGCVVDGVIVLAGGDEG